MMDKRKKEFRSRSAHQIRNLNLDDVRERSDKGYHFRPAVRMKKPSKRRLLSAVATALIAAYALSLHRQLHLLNSVGGDKNNMPSLQRLIQDAPPLESPMQVIVLTMDRFLSLKRLIRSLQLAEYGGDAVHLTIRWDKSTTTTHAPVTVESLFGANNNIMWPHGNLTMHFSSEHIGLRQAWIDAWVPQSQNEHAIILEDDITVSPAWYAWYKQAVARYPEADSFSLQRQWNIPELMGTGGKSQVQGSLRDMEGKHFMYALLGSIGFAPRASVWDNFIKFAKHAIANNGKLISIILHICY